MTAWIAAFALGILIGIVLGFFWKVEAITKCTHLYEVLYAQRQQAIVIAAGEAAAHNNVRGRKNNKDRRIITPGDADYIAGTSVPARGGDGVESAIKIVGG